MTNIPPAAVMPYMKAGTLYHNAAQPATRPTSPIPPNAIFFLVSGMLRSNRGRKLIAL